MELREWLSSYLRMKDMDGLLRTIDVKDALLIATYAEGQKKFIIADVLQEKHFAERVDGICTSNSEENFSFLTKHWSMISSKQGLMLIFVNVTLHDKWILFPYTHNQIADPATLQQGLRSMFDLANGKVTEAPSKKKKGMFEESSEDGEDSSDDEE